MYAMPRYPVSYQQYGVEEESGGAWMGYLMVLLIILGVAAYFANAYYIKNVEGIWEYVPDDPTLDAFELSIIIDEETKTKIRAVGKFPGDNKGFLSYGVYPFLYMVSLYPINTPTANLKIKFLPYPKNGEFYLNLSRPTGGPSFVYKKIDNIKKDVTTTSKGSYGG